MQPTLLSEPQTTDEAVERLGELARTGFDGWSSLGDIRAQRDGRLLLLTYTDRAQYAGRWNAYERACRGLVLNAVTGEVVARPFDKFFNWGERGLQTDAAVDYVMEKIDGSLIITFWHGGCRTATRGRFTSPQAEWARQRLAAANGVLETLLPGHTLLLEAVYPENRVVVDYGGREALYLLAIRDTLTGEYAPWEIVKRVALAAGFPTPRVYDHLDTADGIRAALEGLTANEEGFVAVFKDGSRFKFKGAEYLRLHKLVSGLSFKSAVEALRDGRVEELRQVIPEELRVEFDGWVTEVEELVKFARVTVKMAMLEAPADDRKAFALWAQTHPVHIRPLLFAALDGKPLEPMIFKHILSGIKGEGGRGE